MTQINVGTAGNADRPQEWVTLEYIGAHLMAVSFSWWSARSPAAHAQSLTAISNPHHISLTSPFLNVAFPSEGGHPAFSQNQSGSGTGAMSPSGTNWTLAELAAKVGNGLIPVI